jgi:hypothetical protein
MYIVPSKVWYETLDFNCCWYKLTTLIRVVEIQTRISAWQEPTYITFIVATFWDIAPCSPYVNRHLGGTYHHLLQGRKSADQETSLQQGPATFMTTVVRTSNPALHILLSFITMCGEQWPRMWSSAQSSWLQTQRSRIRFPALLDFLNSNGSSTAST